MFHGRPSEDVKKYMVYKTTVITPVQVNTIPIHRRHNAGETDILHFNYFTISAPRYQ